MPINYEPVGWDTTKFVNPTNMNQMDNGIKAACDGVDALTEEVADVNESLTIVYDAPSGYTINQLLSMIASYVPVASTRLFRGSIAGSGGHYSGFMTKINDVAITGHMVLNNPQSSYRFNRDSEAVWSIEELVTNSDLMPSTGGGFVYFVTTALGTISTMMPYPDSISKTITLTKVTINGNDIGVSRFSLGRRTTGFFLSCADSISAEACANQLVEVTFTAS